jgi:hypothetical protein
MTATASPHFMRSGGRDHVLVVSYFKGEKVILQGRPKWKAT